MTTPLLSALLEPVDESLRPLAGDIERCVEEDGSDLRDTASPRLRKLRAEVRNGAARVRDELARVARSADVRDALQETFLAERGGRPVLAVRAPARAKVPGIVHDASSTGQTLFVEPFAVVELNNRLAEAAADAREEAERILQELSASVAGHGEAVVALVEATGAADLALACGMLSRGWRGAPVSIGEDVRLIGARHPLLDPAGAVPIDLDLGAIRALVISGPNTGGKTVALKTLGLAALLHQCGLRPPADDGDAAGLRPRARRHRRPPVDRDEPLDVLRARAHARRRCSTLQPAARSCCSTRSRRAPIRRRDPRSPRRSLRGSRGRRG